MRRRLRGLGPWGWFVVATTPFMTAFFVASILINLDQPPTVIAGHVMTAIGWPLLAWGSLRLLAGPMIPGGFAQVRRRRVTVDAAALWPDVTRGIRVWLGHLGSALVFLGGAITIPSNDAGPQWIRQWYPPVAVALVVGYLMCVAVVALTRRRHRGSATADEHSSPSR